MEKQLTEFMCAIGSKLPLFPYNRGWETQPNSRGLYTHYRDSLLLDDHPQYKELIDPGSSGHERYING